MRSGNLKHKIEIQAYTETQNEYGEPIKSYTPFKTVYASIVPLSAKEFFASKHVNAEVTHKIEFRYKAGILPTMRIVYNGRIFEIESILNIREVNKTLQLLCVEAV